MFQSIRKSDKDRLLNTLNLKKTDQIPLIELGIHPEIKSKILGRKINSISDDLEFMSSMGYDFIKLQPIINFQMDFGHSINKNVVDRNWAPEKSGVIQNSDDFEKYNWPRISDINYSRFEEARKIIPDNMAIIGQYGDLFTVAWELMGFENFAMATYENPELVKLLMDKLAEYMFNMFETMSNLDFVDILWFSDDIAYTQSLMLSPDFYREYFFPHLKKIAGFARRMNKPFIYHTDGLLWDVIDDIIECGVTALHPIEPKAMNISEVQEKYGNKLCLCGGIDVDMLARGTQMDVEILVNRMIKELYKKGGWCAGSSNSIPDYVNVENYLKMVELIIRYKC